jgi:mRNA interferase MazF
MRGEIYRLKSLRNARGHEQRGNRLCVVLQSDALPLSTWLIAPTSTSAIPASFRPAVDVAGEPTLVLVEQVTAVDPERLGERVGRLSNGALQQVDSALKIVLDLA